jgi:hypothetical protein
MALITKVLTWGYFLMAEMFEDRLGFEGVLHARIESRLLAAGGYPREYY